jgi:hypothetical protein
MESARHHTSRTRRQEGDRARRLTGRQSLGWEHYEVHEPEPHILLFKYASIAPMTEQLLTRAGDRTTTSLQRIDAIAIPTQSHIS